jgi:dTDP-4-amino-4,6-dideoxygalactose transaminase
MQLPKPIALIDLKAQQTRLGGRIREAIERVLDHGQYIMGPEVKQLERALCAFSGARHAVTCASGTDALLMVLMAKGIGPGDAVICPAFTFTATPEAVALLRANLVFADVDERTFNLDPEGLGAAMAAARNAGHAPKAIIVADLFGLPADYDAILAFAERHGLFVVADAAQSFGASSQGRRVGTFGLATATSFFPAKPLGCYGDGGAILTDDDALATALDSIRAHGKGTQKYDIVRIGINGRLDTLQAAILIEKLKIFPEEIEARQQVADRYRLALSGLVGVPRVPAGSKSVWAQYTVRVPAHLRDTLAEALRNEGIPTAVYYPTPVHHQVAYRHFPVAFGGLRVAERLPTEVLSLPMHAYLSQQDQHRIVKSVTRYLGDKMS